MLSRFCPAFLGWWSQHCPAKNLEMAGSAPQFCRNKFFRPPKSEAMYTLKIATTESELKEIFNLRYRVQVEELGRQDHPGATVDHINKQLIDPIDESSVNMGAYRDGQLVGCIRLSLNNSDHFTYYRGMLEMDDFAGSQPDKCCFASRLVVDPKLRHSRVNLLLMLFCFEVAVENKQQFCFIECLERLTSYYEKYGFQPYTRNSTTTSFGVLRRMVFDLCRVDHLKEIRSPFLGVLGVTYAEAA
jgi:predicted GNAT family N-acyltransferase